MRNSSGSLESIFVFFIILLLSFLLSYIVSENIGYIYTSLILPIFVIVLIFSYIRIFRYKHYYIENSKSYFHSSKLLNYISHLYHNDLKEFFFTYLVILFFSLVPNLLPIYIKINNNELAYNLFFVTIILNLLFSLIFMIIFTYLITPHQGINIDNDDNILLSFDGGIVEISIDDIENVQEGELFFKSRLILTTSDNVYYIYTNHSSELKKYIISCRI